MIRKELMSLHIEIKLKFAFIRYTYVSYISDLNRKSRLDKRPLPFRATRIILIDSAGITYLFFNYIIRRIRILSRAIT